MILKAQDKLYANIEKIRLLRSYLFELAYDLAIASVVNVSESPGFESFVIATVLSYHVMHRNQSMCGASEFCN